MTLAWILLTLLLFVSLFLMLVILLQRGRGGGLAGAFGGVGGRSAFGTKAGDVVTVITIVTLRLWVLLACFSGWAVRNASESYMQGDEEEAEAVEPVPEKTGRKPRATIDEESEPSGGGKAEKSGRSKPGGAESSADQGDDSGSAGGES